MKRALSILTTLTWVLAWAVRTEPAAIASESTQLAAKTIVAEEQLYCLVESRAEATVDTEIYVAAGQNRENWTQMLICQRIHRKEPLSAEALLEQLKPQFNRADGSVQLLTDKVGRRAAVFGIRLREPEGRLGQISVACAYNPNGASPGELEVIQYTGKLGQGDDGIIERQARVWQERFYRQWQAMR